MNTSTIIEMVGYLGSFLVLVSFLMVSVVKLRIVNTVGSLIFMIYALIIKSYPTAIMNFFLVLINLHFLYRLNKKDEKEFSLVEVNKNDSLLKYLLNTYHDDIMQYYPECDTALDKMNKGYVIVCQGKPVGITLGVLEDNNFDIVIDYTTTEFRDFSIGHFLFDRLNKNEIKTITFKYPIDKHEDYIRNMNFQKENDYYIKHLV